MNLRERARAPGRAAPRTPLTAAASSSRGPMPNTAMGSSRARAGDVHRKSAACGMPPAHVDRAAHTTAEQGETSSTWSAGRVSTSAPRSAASRQSPRRPRASIRASFRRRQYALRHREPPHSWDPVEMSPSRRALGIGVRAARAAANPYGDTCRHRSVLSPTQAIGSTERKVTSCRSLGKTQAQPC